MNIKTNIWRILGFILIIALCFIFFKIIIYLTISLVLFLIGYPLTYRLEKIRIGKRRLPDSLAALITVCLMIGLVFGFFSIVIPPLVNEIRFLSELNFYDVLHNLLEQFPQLKSALLKLGNEHELKSSLTEQFNGFIASSNITGTVNNLLDYAGTIAGGTLIVLFVTFFLLKDEQIVHQTILTLTPSGKENKVSDIMTESKKMLSKYFAALFVDVFIVGILVMVILSILGIKNALLIALVAGILNIIPYIGSVITMLIAIFLGVSGCINAGTYELIGPTINKIFFALLCVNLFDGFIVQPLIFSSSVKAHPLEIFVVVLMAATIAGVPGMILALPVYTLIRITAKEFLTQFKFFRKISENLDE